MSKRGARTTGEARLIREATARGWVRLDRSGANHVKLYWPPSGVTTVIPSKMDDGFVKRVLQRLIKMEQQHADLTN